MTDESDLTPEQEAALMEQAVANVALDPSLYDDARSLGFAGVEQYRLAAGALELALADYDALDVPLAIEAMGKVKAHIGLGDLLMQEVGCLVVFGRSDETTTSGNE